MELNFINNSILCRFCLKESLTVISIYCVVEIVLVDDNEKDSNTSDAIAESANDNLRIIDLLAKCFPIFEVYKKQLTYGSSTSHTYFGCFVFQIRNDDEFPKQICYECLEKLNVSFNFWKQIQESDCVLRNTGYAEVAVASKEGKNEAQIGQIVNNSNELKFADASGSLQNCDDKIIGVDDNISVEKAKEIRSVIGLTDEQSNEQFTEHSGLIDVVRPAEQLEIKEPVELLVLPITV